MKLAGLIGSENCTTSRLMPELRGSEKLPSSGIDSSTSPTVPWVAAEDQEEICGAVSSTFKTLMVKISSYVNAGLPASVARTLML